jgi:carbon monoxide dehydrogenase subunit G
VTRFHARNHSTAVVAADRDRIWDVLSNPQLLAHLTPLVREIIADGDRWLWQLAGITGLGLEVVPAFTEQMTFTPRERIDFHHDPPRGRHERAGANGHYVLADHPDGTQLEIDITIHVDLPLPRLSRAAVTRVMEESMHRTGDIFARNLANHLDIPHSPPT